FITLDIETDEHGHATHVGIYNGEDFKLFTNVHQSLIHLLNTWEEFNVVYAHCGMKFDYSLILKSLLGFGHVSVAYSGSQGVFMEFFGRNGERFTLLDSYRLLPASLKKLSSMFCSHEDKKIDLDVMPWELEEDKLIEYLERDCTSLYQSITKFWEIIDNNFGCTRARTLSSLALKIYRKKYQKENYMGSNRKLYEYELSSYFGGVCWVRNGYYREVAVYDINSMYPNAMSKYEYPTSYVGGWTKSFKGKLGLYLVKYQHSGLPFIFDIEERTLKTSGVSIVDNETYKYLLEIGNIELIEGYVYFRKGYIFTEFVEDLYGLRLASKEPLNYCYKILLNSLYGKFGQKRTRRTLSTKEPKVKYKSYAYRIVDTGIEQYREVFDYEEKVIVKHSMPCIASMVTLHSRRHLHQIASQYPTVYMDTDSIHIDLSKPHGELPTHSLELGGLKEEYRGEATYLGKKIYQLHSAHKTRCKGIPSTVMKNVEFRELISPTAYEFDTFPSVLKQVKRNINFGKEVASRTITPVRLNKTLED
ncbi:MAG: DNA polymerase, partial [Microcoleaceae cyanobacterium]